jgi:hypothetical protein
MLQTSESLLALLCRVEYKNWRLRIGEMGEGFFLQWRFFETDNTDASDTALHLQGCRKWYVSPHATDSEVMNTAYLAAEIAERHEFMERFLVDGKPLRNPHADVFALLGLNLPNDSRQNLELSLPDCTTVPAPTGSTMPEAQRLIEMHKVPVDIQELNDEMEARGFIVDAVWPEAPRPDASDSDEFPPVDLDPQEAADRAYVHEKNGWQPVNRKTVNLSAPVTRAITAQIRESLERRPQFVTVQGSTINLDNIVGLFWTANATYTLVVKDGPNIVSIPEGDGDAIRRQLQLARRP